MAIRTIRPVEAIRIVRAGVGPDSRPTVQIRRRNARQHLYNPSQASLYRVSRAVNFLAGNHLLNSDWPVDIGIDEAYLRVTANLANDNNREQHSPSSHGTRCSGTPRRKSKSMTCQKRQKGFDMCYQEEVRDNILHVTVEHADDPAKNESYWDHAHVVANRFLIVADVITDPEFMKVDYTIGRVNVEVEWIEDWSDPGEEVCFPAASCPRCGNAFTPCEGTEQSANEPVKTRGCPHCGLRRLAYDAQAVTWAEVSQAFLDEQKAVKDFLADLEETP